MCELPDKVMEGDSGWVLQEVLSQTFKVLSLHSSGGHAKKRGIGKKLILTIRAVMLYENVAGDSTLLHGSVTPGTTVPSKRPFC